MKQQDQTNKTKCRPFGFVIHSPEMYPRFFHVDDFSIFQYGMDIDVDIIPEIIKTDRELRKLSPKNRECYFEDEKSLKFFKVYSRENCVIECLVNYSQAFCPCSELWRLNENENYCYKYGKRMLCDASYLTNFRALDIPLSPNCSCLPTCDSVTYHIKYFHKFSTQSDEISINLRVNTEDAILFRRYQQFTFSDVVSYVGGLLGLFAGISMLSIVEIFYFFLIRPVVDVWRALRGQ
jgi:amiloride-sensitive sodium channel